MRIVRKELYEVESFMREVFPWQSLHTRTHAPQNFTQHVDIEALVDVRWLFFDLQPSGHKVPWAYRLSKLGDSRCLIWQINESKITQKQGTVVVHKNILRFDIPMNDPLSV